MEKKIKTCWVSIISIAVLLTGIGGVSAPAAAEKIVLRITDWQAGVQNILDSYREFKKIFEEKHPDVKVEYTQYSYTTYGEFLKPALAAGTAPDIFAVYPGAELAKLVPSGNLVAISDVIDEEWKGWLG
ncbi:MAG: extracellular solute-binding protein, partial [Candidatus Aerophobus sp.]